MFLLWIKSQAIKLQIAIFRLNIDIGQNVYEILAIKSLLVEDFRRNNFRAAVLIMTLVDMF